MKIIIFIVFGLTCGIFQVMGSPLKPPIGFTLDDMILSEEQQKVWFGPTEGVNAKTGVTNEPRLWLKNENGEVVIPYNIDPSQGYEQHHIDYMLREFTAISNSTCVRFVERTDEVDFVDIINGIGCKSYVGRLGGNQSLTMQANGCMYNGFAMHEMIHAIGFVHMQNHYDRDNYITIHWENVQEGREGQFNKIESHSYSLYDTPYDYLSVMHGPKWAWSKNGKDVVVPHDRSYIEIIGEVGMLSAGDALRINRMFNCFNINEVTEETTTVSGDTTSETTIH